MNLENDKLFTDRKLTARQNFFRLLNSRNTAMKITDATVEIGVPCAIGDPKRTRNTEILLKAKPGGGMTGEVLLKYDRIDLSVINKNRDTLSLKVVTPNGLFYIQHDPTDAICDHFHLLREELEFLYDRNVEDGYSACWIKAKPDALLYCRSFLVYFHEYTAVPTLKARLSLADAV